MFLFDTSVFSYALKGHSLAVLYEPELESGEESFISVQTGRGGFVSVGKSEMGPFEA